MTTIESAASTIREPVAGFEFDEAQLAAVSFLARYSGRTLEAYRHDLRGFFQWATDTGIAVLEASRAHIEMFRAWMEDHGLAASTIDRRLSTVWGFYRFAHLERAAAKPAAGIPERRHWAVRSRRGTGSARRRCRIGARRGARGRCGRRPGGPACHRRGSSARRIAGTRRPGRLRRPGRRGSPRAIGTADQGVLTEVEGMAYRTGELVDQTGLLLGAFSCSWVG
jgi:Phage integrase, N-terminal SAM-like domain